MEGVAMTWTEKVAQGMVLIREGCSDNKSWVDCDNCPFTDFCDSIMEANDGQDPADLFLPNREAV